MSEHIHTAQVTPQDTPRLLELFDACRSTCFCRYWHFEGHRNDWLDRCANDPKLNRERASAAWRAEDDAGRGVLAAAGSRVIGWMKLAPALALPKLYGQRLYAGLPCFDDVPRDEVMTVGCFLVHPEHRRRGVAGALLKEGLLLAAKRGATHVEALPRRGDYLYPEALAMGPFSVFERAGFEVVREFEPYPVLRKTLVDR